MKKVVFALILLLMPIFVRAEVDYDITDYYISSEIEVAGGIKIKELIVLDGTFNGYERQIVYKNSSLPEWKTGNVNFEKSSIYNATGIDNLKVSSFKAPSKVNFDTMNSIDNYSKEATSGSLGDKDIYTIETTDDVINVKMFKPSDDEKIAFYLEYVITNAIVIHNDVAELYFPYVGDQFSDPIDNVQVRVFLPQPDNSDNFRIWAHGPLTGEVNKYQNKNKENIGLLATTKDLAANTGFDIRMTFDKSLILIPDFLDHSKENALPKILEVEENRANDANNKRKKMKVIYNTIKISSYIYLAGLIALWIYTYIKFDKEYKSEFKSKYYREFIEDYDVEVIDYLFNKNITSNAMSASILNLIYKKKIRVEEIPSDKKKKEYTFYLENKENLSDAENYLVEFLFEDVGSENKFTTKELKNYAKDSASAIKFTTKYTRWKNKVIKDGENQQFYEKNNSIKLYGALYFAVGMVIFFINLMLDTNIFIAYFIMVPMIIFLIYILTFNKRSKKGNDHYTMWKAFKNFLNDFGTFETKELPEIKLWERYMVYATIFGLADKVQKSMNVHIQEMDPNQTIYPTYYHSWLFYDMNYSIANMINSTVNSAIQSSITAVASSSNSSGGGFGGGFSSGSGGGFGGGGGGHGF